MKWLTLELIKQALRIDNDLEDALLEHYGKRAEAMVLNDINRDYDDLIENFGELSEDGKTKNVPEPIVDASLLLVSASYDNRSAITSQTMSLVPYGYDYDIKPYMRLARKENS